MPKTESYDVNLPYTLGEIKSLHEYAQTHDVEQGGRYDTGSAAINVWTHPWNTLMTRHESTLVGTFYFYWATRIRIWKIMTEEGFSYDDLLHELAIIEEQALGHAKHGKRSS